MSSFQRKMRIILFPLFVCFWGLAVHAQDQSQTNPHQPQEKNLSKLEQTKSGESEENKITGEKKKTEDKEKKKSPHKLTGTVAFLSDYRSRGISQTFRRPAIQGELKYTHASGFYFKSWASNIDGTGQLFNNTSMEWDLSLGFKHSLFHTKAEYDVGFLYYYYPGGKAHVRSNTSYDTVEYYIAWSYKKFEIKLSLTITDYIAVNSSNPPINLDTGRTVPPNGHSFGSPYIEANYEYPFYPKWKALFHLGYQGVTNYPQLNFLDGLIGLTREFEWFEITLAYVQTNARKAFYNIPDNSFRPRRVNLGGPGVVLGINRTF
jgi:uncharacterized protein (TIGR02001 family)